jgi:hypothetical protein
MNEPDANIKSAVNILALIAEDLSASAFVFSKISHDKAFMAGIDLEIPIYRMTMSSLIISCSKYTEFCRKYGAVVNKYAPNLVSEMNKQKIFIEEKGINSTRNDFFGHIHSKKLGRPLTSKEVTDRFVGITGGDIYQFLNWIITGENEQEFDKLCFVGFLYRLIDQLRKSL